MTRRAMWTLSRAVARAKGWTHVRGQEGIPPGPGGTGSVSVPLYTENAFCWTQIQTANRLYVIPQGAVWISGKTKLQLSQIALEGYGATPGEAVCRWAVAFAKAGGEVK